LATSPHENRIIGLEGLRAVSLVLVLQAHWDPSLRFEALAEWGRGGLIVFFVISGFLITGILADLRERVAEGEISFGSAICGFYARRAFRIFPVYYLALAFVLYRQMNTAVSADWLWHVLFLNNISNVLLREDIGVYGAAFPWWSLAVEEQFYVFWAPLVLLLPKRHLPRMILIMIAGGVGFRSFCWIEGYPLGDSFILTLGNIDSLAAGAAAAALVRRRAANEGINRIAAPALMAACTIAFGWLVSERLRLGYLAFRPLLENAVFSDIVWYSFFASLVYLFATDRAVSVGAALNNAVLKYIGQRSYGAYVFHHVIAISLFQKTVLGVPIGLTGPLAFTIYFILTVIVAAASFRFYEQPIMKLRNRLFPTHASAAAGASSRICATKYPAI
jgi:peptidoglycan/LPS O-acetylase OafA/YrhL